MYCAFEAGRYSCCQSVVSLFHDYVAQLIKYDKKFFIVGHQNAIHCKGIFLVFIKSGVWLG